MKTPTDGGGDFVSPQQAATQKKLRTALKSALPRAGCLWSYVLCRTSRCNIIAWYICCASVEGDRASRVALRRLGAVNGTTEASRPRLWRRNRGRGSVSPRPCTGTLPRRFAPSPWSHSIAHQETRSRLCLLQNLDLSCRSLGTALAVVLPGPVAFGLYLSLQNDEMVGKIVASCNGPFPFIMSSRPATNKLPGPFYLSVVISSLHWIRSWFTCQGSRTRW